jgi:hypothetical protein
MIHFTVVFVPMIGFITLRLRIMPIHVTMIGFCIVLLHVTIPVYVC